MPTGLEELDLNVYIDYPQQRQNRRGPFVFATDGTQVDKGTAVNCIIDPVTLSTFGTPLPMTNEWKSNFSNHYARFAKTDFTFVNSIKWKQYSYYGNGDYYIISNSELTADQQSTVELTGGVNRNEALFFSFSKLQKKNTDSKALLTLSWSNATNKDKNTKLVFNSDGSCDVYRGFVPLTGFIIASTTGTAITGIGSKFLTQFLPGNKLYDRYGRELGTIATVTNDLLMTLSANSAFDYTGSYSKGNPLKVQSYSRTENNYSQGRPISTLANPNDQYNDVYIIPMRGRDLLVLTSFGLNFCHSFSDLNVPDPPANVNVYMDNAPNTNSTNASSVPIILPSGSFSININQGKVGFQLAKLFFRSNWSIESQTITTPQAPPPIPIELTGTITTIQGSTTVNGTGTLFTTELAPGDRVSFINQDIGSIIIGTVDTITSNTAFELFDPSQYKVTNNTFTKETALTGLFTYSTANNNVTGSGTLFSTELAAGDYLYNNNNVFIGIVANISSNTALTLLTNAEISGTNQTPVWKNINLYSSLFVNYQSEFFGQLFPVVSDRLRLLVQIVDIGGNATKFDNTNTIFKIKIRQENIDDASPVASTDYCQAFYSFDSIYNLKNEYTSDTPVNIKSALETFSLSRNETGELTLNLSARKKLLEDLGVVKPEIISNRPIKVSLTPRPPVLLSGLISFFATEIIYGQDTLFLTEISPGDTLYANDGTPIGIVDYIVDDFELGLLSNFIGGTVEDIEYTNIPNYEEISIFEGYLDSPNIEYIYGQNYDRYSLLSFSAIDKKQHLNTSYFSVAPNFDNNPIDSLIGNAIILAGQSNNDVNSPTILVDPTIKTYQVLINRNNSNGQYNFVLNLGDTSGGLIEKIRSDFAQNFTFYAKGDWSQNQLTEDGFNYSTFFKLKDLDYILDKPPFVSLYLNEQSANTDGGIPIYESYKRTIRKMAKSYETPEANRIIIVGLDKANGARIEYIKDDYASQNPTTIPASRNDNWLGDVYPFVMINDKLNSFSDVEQSGRQFYAKLSEGRELLEFECDFLTYFDYTSKFTSQKATPLSGTITIDGTVDVTGVSSLFTTELSVGETLYKSDGTIIGIISVITNDTNLSLISNNIPGIEYNISYNNFTYYLNQYRYVDIGDVIYVNDLDNNSETYEILDWDFAGVREYINPDNTSIIVRSAKYKAKKVTIPANNPPIFAFGYTFNDYIIPKANQWIITYDELLTINVGSAFIGQYETGVFSLTNNPTGMVINSATGVITWTPTSGQSNQIFEDIQVNLSDGIDTTSYLFSVRVYDTL
jgi:hypothetical protein